MLTNLELKNELLYMFNKVDNIIKQYQLNYSMMSGTLLGAVRHGGFIPWDDDIDIAMPREDYDKFIKLIKEGMLDSYGLSATGYEIDKNYWPFMKIVNPEILIEQDMDGYSPPGEYLWIDVFPFDYIDKDNAEDILRKIAHQRKLLGYKIAQERKYYRYKRNIIKKIGYILLSAIYKFKSVEKINNNIILLSRGDGQKSEFIADLTWGTDKPKKIIPFSLFEDIVDYQFEDITVKGFKDYDMYLTQLYGDYMKLPPEDQRENHGIKAWRVNNNEK